MVDEKKDKKDKKKPDKKKSKQSKPSGSKPEEEDKDFVHLVRISGVVVDGKLTIPKALMKIKGVGPRVAESIVPKFGYNSEVRIGSLKEEQINSIEESLEKISSSLPAWMLNRRKDIETGADAHNIGPELDMQRREDINREKKTKSYRGVRHHLNLPVRGQRTKSSFRKGSTIGVSRKKAK